MKHEEREYWRQELLEYHYGCHPNPEQVEKALAENSSLRAFYDESIKATVAWIDQATRGEEVDVGELLSGVMEEAPDERPWRRLSRWTKVAALLIVFVMAGLLGTSSWMTAKARKVEGTQLRVTVEGPTRIPDMALGKVQIKTWGAEGEPRGAFVKWTLRGRDGRDLAHGDAESRGTLDLSLPVVSEPYQSLDVVAETQTSWGEATARCQWLVNSSASSCIGHLRTDRPSYRIGDTVYVRALFLDPLSMAPIEGRFHLRVIDPQDSVVRSHWLQAEAGVAAFAFHTNEGRESAGIYRIGWSESSTGESIHEASFLMRGSEPPRLEKSITLDARRYSPGQGGVAEFQAKRLGGGVVADASIEGVLSCDSKIIWRGKAQTNRLGKARLPFQIPEETEPGVARLSIRVEDDGWSETASKQVPILLGIPHVMFYPEGGDLVVGVRGRIYVECTDELGSPMSVSGRILDPEDREVLSLEVPETGRTRFEFTPEATSYRLVTSSGETMALPEVKATGVVIQTRQDVIEAKDDVRFDLVTPDERLWTAALFRRGQRLGQSVVQGRGTHRLSIDPGHNVLGVLRLTIFDDQYRPCAERLVYRLSGRQLQVSCELESESLTPGEEQRLRFRVTDDAGDPVKATLGVSVFDRASELASPLVPVSLRSYASLGSDLESLEGWDDFSLASSGQAPEKAYALDLLLGTRGWRRFAWYDLEETAERSEERFEVLAFREGGSVVTTKASSRDQAEARARSYRQRAENLRVTVILGSALLVILTLVFFTIRYSYRAFSAKASHPLVRWGIPLVHGACLLVVLCIGAMFLFSQQLEEMAPTADLAIIAGMAAPMDEKAEGEASGVDRDVSLGLESLGDYWEDLEDDSVTDSKSAREKANRHRSIYVREYSHQHPKREATWLRDDRAETVYWNAGLETDDQGFAEVAFDVSDRVTTWVLRVDAIGSLPGDLYALGEASGAFDTEVPLQLDLKTPYFARPGDSLELPIGIRTEGVGEDEVLVRWKASGLDLANDRGVWRLGEEGSKPSIPLDIPAAFEGKIEVFALGKWGEHMDGIKRVIDVRPREFRKHLTRSGWLEEEDSFEIDIPSDVATGDLQASVMVYPSVVDTLNESFEGMLRAPHGCFEQVSSSTYPNVLILTLQNAMSDGVTPVQQRAFSYVAQGYDKLRHFEVEGGGFDWFGQAPANDTLTAYGLMEFVDMAQVFPVDESLLERTRQWLQSRRDGEGKFFRADRSFYGFPHESADAYITWALLYAGVDEARLEPELDRIAARVSVTQDAYELALLSHALGLTQRHEDASRARNRLANWQTEEGMVGRGGASWTGSGRQDLQVEATSLAALAWMEDLSLRPQVERAMGWILTQRDHDGRFGATQATVLALKAIVAYQKLERVERQPGKVELWINGERASQRNLGPRSSRSVRLHGAQRNLRAGVQEITLRDESKGGLPWTVDISYTSQKPSDDPGAPLEVEIQPASSEAPLGDVVDVEVTVASLRMQSSSMGVAILGLPANLEYRPQDLEALRSKGAFDFWESRDHELVLYWRSFGGEEVKSFRMPLTAAIPGHAEGGASRAYLYYSPNLVNWAEPMAITVTQPTR